MVDNELATFFQAVEGLCSLPAGTMETSRNERFRAADAWFIDSASPPLVVKRQRTATAEGISLADADIDQEVKNLAIAAAALKNRDHRVIRVVGCLPEYRTVVSERVDGLQLHLPLLNRKSTLTGDASFVAFLAMVRASGAWLADLHRATSAENAPVVDRELDAVRDFILERVEPIRELTYSGKRNLTVAALKNRLLPAIDSIKVSKPKVCFTHNDFNLGNIFCSGETVTVLDFGEARYSFPENDLAWFRMMCDDNFENFPVVGAVRSGQIWNAFVAGYGMPVSTNSALFRLYTLKGRMITLLTLGKRLKSNPWLKETISARLSIFHQRHIIHEWF